MYEKCNTRLFKEKGLLAVLNKGCIPRIMCYYDLIFTTARFSCYFFIFISLINARNILKNFINKVQSRVFLQLKLFGNKELDKNTRMDEFEFFF